MVISNIFFASKAAELCAALELVRLVCPRIPLSRYSLEGPRLGTKAKGSQNLLNSMPFVSFLRRAPLGYAAFSSLRVLRKVSFFPFHAQYVKIDSLPFFSH